ncbi:MAG TPA: hypothetical protein DCE55_01190 [Planctomycetaceae bacterium]|nr:hypothetical protein [Planctomycetaceae bacterium]
MNFSCKIKANETGLTRGVGEGLRARNDWPMRRCPGARNCKCVGYWRSEYGNKTKGFRRVMRQVGAAHGMLSLRRWEHLSNV